MAPKRERSSSEEYTQRPLSKKLRTRNPLDHISSLSDELLIRILHHIPIQTLIQCQRISHRLYRLAGDSQIWKNLYYNRFVLPRALRIPGIKSAPSAEALYFSSRQSKWLDENSLLNRDDGKQTNWKKQYKLRHNWSIGACEMQEIHLADRPSVPSMLVRLAEGVVLTADSEEGLRAWDLKGKELIAKLELDECAIPSCLAVDEPEPREGRLGVAVGFVDGGWGTYTLDVEERKLEMMYRHPASSNGMLSAVAYSNTHILTITDSQLLSLYTFNPAPTLPDEEDLNRDLDSEDDRACTKDELALPLLSPSAQSISGRSEPQPHLLASLKSHTSWPPISLSIRTTSSTIVASIAYSLPTYLSGYTIGLQELHLSLVTGTITFSRLASALPPGFSSLLNSPPSPSSASGSSSPIPNRSPASTHQLGSFTRPTTLSYSHPYILATHTDNTLSLYLCTSTSDSLTISPGTKLWGHTSSVSSAEITPRGKAVSVSTRGNELRVWELEGGLSTPNSKRRVLTKGARLSERSVRIRPELRDADDEVDSAAAERYQEETEASKRWVGFDDEMVIVLKESGRGTQALMVYDFT